MIRNMLSLEPAKPPGPRGRVGPIRPDVTVPVLVSLALALSGVALPRSASAYSKFEHEQLTYYAFALAEQLVCTGDSPPDACGGLLEIHPTELGAVTRAVDYFSNPGRLAPVAAACKEDLEKKREDLGGCRDSMVKACKSKTEQECLAYALDYSRKKVGKRRFNRFYRALALHRNDEHFRQGAQQEYNKLHERAGKLAVEGNFALALVAEAIAIHFLQDGFSPGHLAAPRDQYGDSHAGALHDRANNKGLTVWVGDEICRAASRLEGSLTDLAAIEDGVKMEREFALVTQKKQKGAAEDRGQPKRIPSAKWIPPSALATDLEEFTDVFCGSKSRLYSAFGDKRLLAGNSASTDTDLSQSRHRVSLLALAVMSIKDVLGAGQGRTPLRLCFHPPSQAPRGGGKDPPKTRYWAPGLAVGRRETDWSKNAPCWPQWQKGLIMGYRTDPVGADPPRAAELNDERASADKQPPATEPADEPAPAKKPLPAAEVADVQASAQKLPRSRYDLRVGAHRINSLQVAISYWGEQRRRFEIGHDVVATEKYFKRNRSGILQGIAGRKAVATAGYVFHFEEEADFEVIGAGLVLTTGTQFKDFDLYAAIEPGIGHYRYPGGDTTGYRWSTRVGVGLSLLALEGIVERGLEPDSTGALRKKWRPSVNFRVRLAPSWLALPFQKLKPGR